jgi:hypothetical protein
MVLGLQNKALYRITHKPTGIVVTCDLYRHMHKNKFMCVKVLKAKLWALANLPPVEKVVATYDLPGDLQFPHELIDYKQRTE